jgi:methylated-DNA-protein-cysteine methyltransferase-like protein
VKWGRSPTCQNLLRQVGILPHVEMFEAIHKVILRIPRGKVATYGAVAKAAGFPGASRQVVWALRAAKAPLPWHRVLGAGGKILLPGQNGIEQRLLLEMEGTRFRGSKVDMEACEFLFAGRTARVSKRIVSPRLSAKE